MTDKIKRPKWFRMGDKRKQWRVAKWDSTDRPLRSWGGVMRCETTADMSGLQDELLACKPQRITDNLGRKGAIYAKAWIPTIVYGKRGLQYEIHFRGGWSTGCVTRQTLDAIGAERISSPCGYAPLAPPRPHPRQIARPVACM